MILCPIPYLHSADVFTSKKHNFHRINVAYNWKFEIGFLMSMPSRQQKPIHTRLTKKRYQIAYDPGPIHNLHEILYLLPAITCGNSLIWLSLWDLRMFKRSHVNSFQAARQSLANCGQSGWFLNLVPSRFMYALNWDGTATSKNLPAGAKSSKTL